MHIFFNKRKEIFLNNIISEFNFSWFQKGKFRPYLLIILFSMLIILFTNIRYKLSLIFTILLLLLIIAFLLFKRNKNIFEPIYIFSIYYITIPISIFYSILTEFKTNIFFNNMTLTREVSSLLFEAVILYILGYIFIFLGYYCLTNQKSAFYKINFEHENKISNKVLNIVIIVFSMIGIINFSYNVYIFANGNILQYFINISIRYYEFLEKGTTLGYLFLETAVYTYLYKILREKKNPLKSYKFIILFVLAFLIRLSAGRIFQTFLFLLVFIAIIYYAKWDKNKKNNNKYYILLGSLIIVLAIIVYFLRAISSMSYNNLMTKGIFETIMISFSNFGKYAFDEGNLANIAVMLKILDSWSVDIGYLCGLSFLLPLFNFLPQMFRPKGYQVGVIVKKTWFSDVRGGNLPPTGVAEMYANFALLGPTIGMFVFGMIIKTFYNKCIRKGNYWFMVVFLNITIGFIMLYSNNEFDNFSFWMVIPMMFTYLLIRIMTNIFQKLHI